VAESTDRPAQSWLGRLLAIVKGRVRGSSTERSRRLYVGFRRVLERNDRALELFAEIDDALAGRSAQPVDAITHRIGLVRDEVHRMIDGLAEITGKRHAGLREAFDRIDESIQVSLPFSRTGMAGPLVMSIKSLRADHARLAGTKMANLGEAWWGVVGPEIPDGFVITSRAFARFMEHNSLWSVVDRIDPVAASGNPFVLADHSRRVRDAVLAAAIPPEIEEEVEETLSAMPDLGAATFAVRSSSISEDTSASHAGQYHSELHVERRSLFDAYRKVVASAFDESAVSYRVQVGLPACDTFMAVGCMTMVEARCSGIMFSRDYFQRDADRVVISVTAGVSDGVASGLRMAGEELGVDGGKPGSASSSFLDALEIAQLVKTARMLERYFGRPQDIEWAIDNSGHVFLLQVRPMSFAERAPVPEIGHGLEPLVSGGMPACPGAGSGPVLQVPRMEDLGDVPQGSILVARHASPALSRVMERCAAIVTEVGSPTGHTAILAREFDVPCVVGMDGALDVLHAGRIVTVDAFRCRVFDGAIPVPPREHGPKLTMDAEALTRQALERAAGLVVPLHLVDSSSKEFRPEHIRSLHDITRYIHEMVFEVMFHFGDMVGEEHASTMKLAAKLPFKVLVHDVGGGVARSARGKESVEPSEIESAPMNSFLEGLLDGRIRWDLPRPVSGAGFLSVLGESMTGPPPGAQQLGRISYFVVSDRYMNFSTKAGYHFSTVDTYCGRSMNKNYIHFRFSGGGAGVGRRTRRIRFLETVLTALDFTARTQGDLLNAQLRKVDRKVISARLADLGRIVLVSRQLDMLMDSDSSPEFFARAFLEDRMDVF